MYHSFKENILSRIGYYNDQRGIVNRYLREVQNWNPHLENTKKAIVDGMANKIRNKAIVLGSGWLLDVPIAELAQSFKEVWLVDIYHPSQSVKKASQFPNVRFIQIDITGLAEQIYNIRKLYKSAKFKTPVETLVPTPMIDLRAFDYVISCNILSQLDIILTDYLREKNVYSVEELGYLITLIQNSHIDILPAKRSILISDIEEWKLDGNDQIVEKRPLVIAPIPGIESANSWIWKFDTQKTYYSSFKTYFKVVSLNL